MYRINSSYCVKPLAIAIAGHSGFLKAAISKCMNFTLQIKRLTFRPVAVAHADTGVPLVDPLDRLPILERDGALARQLPGHGEGDQ